MPLDQVVEQEREPRNVQKEVDGEPGKTEFVLETPKEPAQWPVYVFYFKPVIVLLNVVPLLIVLVLYARLLDRYGGERLGLVRQPVRGGAGDAPLRVRPDAEQPHGRGLGGVLRDLPAADDLGRREGDRRVRFAAAGFFGAFCACNELPAALFGVLLFLMLLVRFPGRTLMFFVPAAAIPCVAFLATQYLAFGQFKPVYEEFGTKSYNYTGATGTRRWRWTGSTCIPSRPASICST